MCASACEVLCGNAPELKKREEPKEEIIREYDQRKMKLEILEVESREHSWQFFMI